MKQEMQDHPLHLFFQVMVSVLITLTGIVCIFQPMISAYICVHTEEACWECKMIVTIVQYF